MTDPNEDTSILNKNSAAHPHRRLPFFSVLLLILLSAAMLWAALARDIQAASPISLPVEFYGEYSRDQTDWQPLSKDADLNALKGDLYLRGHFSDDLSGIVVSCHLDHIYYSIVVNGENAAGYIPKRAFAEPVVCGSDWSSWKIDSLSANDTVEIHLSNPHTAGNPRAYAEFLGNLYRGNSLSFSKYMLHSSLSTVAEVRSGIDSEISAPFLYSGQLSRISGFLVLALSILLLGVSVSDSLQGNLLGRRLWYMTLWSISMSVPMILDTSDVTLWSSRLVFNTYGAQLCRMLAVFFLILCAAEFLHQRPKKAAYILAVIDGIADACILIAGIAFRYPLCESSMLWLILQGILLTILLACGIWDLCREKTRRKKYEIIFILIPVCSALAEIANAWAGWWSRGLAVDLVFLIIFMTALVWIIKDVPAQYRAAKHAAQMELELSQSRIAIMLSQIQPHFLYNTLSTIRALCRRDPRKAEEAILEFTEFLRGNMDSLTADTPISFEQELSHTKSYLALEEKRFSNKLNVIYNIGPASFRLPTLTLQPIVENAVRYGVTKRPDGGTVTIATHETETSYIITVKDDGIGFDANQPHKDGRSHIGIANVRQRLASMCNGTLSIASIPDVGTEVTIEIPKEKKVC
jgi:hypothetical protein